VHGLRPAGGNRALTVLSRCRAPAAPPTPAPMSMPTLPSPPPQIVCRINQGSLAVPSVGGGAAGRAPGWRLLRRAPLPGGHEPSRPSRWRWHRRPRPRLEERAGRAEPSELSGRCGAAGRNRVRQEALALARAGHSSSGPRLPARRALAA